MARPLPRASLIDGGVSPTGGTVTVPTRDISLEIAAQGWGDISVRANSFADSMFKLANKKAQSAGAAFGAVNAPTLQEIEIAKQLGQPIDLPGDAGSFKTYEQAAYASGLAVVEDNYSVLANNALAEAGAIAAANPQMTPEMYLEQIDSVGESYVDILHSISPSSAAKLRAEMFAERNKQYLAFSKDYFKKERDERKSVAIIMATEQTEVTKISQSFNGYQYTPGITPRVVSENKRQKLVEHMRINGATVKDIDTFNDAFEKNYIIAERNFFAESMMRGDYGDIDLLDASTALREGNFGDEVFDILEAKDLPESVNGRDVLQSIYNNMSQGQKLEVHKDLRIKNDELKQLNIAKEEAKKAEQIQKMEDNYDPLWISIQNGPKGDQSIEEWYNTIHKAIMDDPLIPLEAGEGEDADYTKSKLIADLKKNRDELTKNITGGERGPTEAETAYYLETINDINAGVYHPESWKKAKVKLMREARDRGLLPTGNSGVNINAILSEADEYFRTRNAEMEKELANARSWIRSRFGIDPGVVGIRLAGDQAKVHHVAEEVFQSVRLAVKDYYEKGKDWRPLLDITSENTYITKKIKEGYARYPEAIDIGGSDPSLYVNLPEREPEQEPEPEPVTYRPLRSDEQRGNSTELTISREVDGKQVLIPTLYVNEQTGDIEELNSNDALVAAMDYERRTGQFFPRYDSIAEADQASFRRSNEGGTQGGPLAESADSLEELQQNQEVLKRIIADEGHSEEDREEAKRLLTKNKIEINLIKFQGEKGDR
tara:strand:+ start:804 stop:3125 length:2322 start_codon:yes stop_codon:yes gene_type:complete